MSAIRVEGQPVGVGMKSGTAGADQRQPLFVKSLAGAPVIAPKQPGGEENYCARQQVERLVDEPVALPFADQRHRNEQRCALAEAHDGHGCYDRSDGENHRQCQEGKSSLRIYARFERMLHIAYLPSMPLVHASS